MPTALKTSDACLEKPTLENIFPTRKGESDEGNSAHVSDMAYEQLVRPLWCLRNLFLLLFDIVSINGNFLEENGQRQVLDMDNDHYGNNSRLPRVQFTGAEHFQRQ